MPELPDVMYCSEQISIPPSFPYLLRQYAKAAIRSQPADLLRWSTAYFRCLSLNLKPPIKPRLEYPIPKSYFGITPGWLKALTYQLENNRMISFQILWDRWIGACLQHKNLIEVLCLGGFTDHTAIPWYRVVALCTSLITESLTQTMILICEILTEEPEGGSAMIPVEVFTDLYAFLAGIDGAHPQVLINLYFPDSLLNVYQEPPVIVAKEEEPEIKIIEEEAIVEAEEEKEEVIEKGPQEDLVGVVISCPDIAPNDYKREEDFENDKTDREIMDDKDPGEEEMTGSQVSAKSAATTKSKSAVSNEKEEKFVKEELEKGEMKVGSVDTLIGFIPERQTGEDDLEEEQREVGVGEEEEPFDLDEYKTLDNNQVSDEILGEVEPSEVPEEEEEMLEEEMLEEEVEHEEMKDEVCVDAIVGIGPTVPQRLIDAVLVYMKECASFQHGMVMPRNIRHYRCPPLEVV